MAIKLLPLSVVMNGFCQATGFNAGDWEAPLLACVEKISIKFEVVSSLLEQGWLLI